MSSSRIERLLQAWLVLAAAAVGGLVVFICGVVLGVYVGVVPLRFGSSTVVGEHEALWMWCLTGLSVAVAALLGWLVGRGFARRAASLPDSRAPRDADHDTTVR